MEQTGWHGHYLGEVELVVQKHKLRKARAVLLDRRAVQKMAGEPDSGVQTALQEIETKNKTEFQQVVAMSPRAMSGDRNLVRVQESELGNLTADAMRWGADADAAVVNGGGIRADLPAGQLTRADLMSVFPFGNTLLKLEVRGKAIHDMLEQSVKFLPAPSGGFLQVSGLTFTLNKSAKAGKRVTDIRIGNAPVEPDKLYTLAVNDFNAAGGDGYTMLKAAKIVGEYGTLEEIFASYLNQRGIQPADIGRITVK